MVLAKSQIKVRAVDNKIRLKDNFWSFSTKGLDTTFAEHIRKSIPNYIEGHDLICEISDYFIDPYEENIIYDLGCSVGDLALQLAERHTTNTSKVIGIDREEQMINKANSLLEKQKNLLFYCHDFLNYDFCKASLFISYYTLQFLSLSKRRQLLIKIYNSLRVGGGLIIFEKVLEVSSWEQDLFSTLYKNFKLNNGLEADQVLAKEQSLKGFSNQ